ncbi:MAG: transporter substrate-binding domain-containing protein, partial [Dokdonella sp.]
MERRALLASTATAGVLAGLVTQSALAQSVSGQSPVASGRLKKILDRGHLIVGTRSTTVGFGFKDAKGDLVGFDVDLAHEMARGLFEDATKIQFEVFNSGAERAPALNVGRADMVISQFSVLDARAQVLDFSIPYCNSSLGAVVRASSPYRKYADLNNKTVTTRQDEEVRKLIVAAVPKANVTMYPSYSDA